MSASRVGVGRGRVRNAVGAGDGWGYRVVATRERCAGNGVDGASAGVGVVGAGGCGGAGSSCVGAFGAGEVGVRCGGVRWVGDGTAGQGAVAVSCAAAGTG